MKVHNRTMPTLLALTLTAAAAAAGDAAYKLNEAKEKPEGLSEKVAAELDEGGWQVVGAEGPLAEVWLAKGIEVRPGFKPSLMVNYPFSPGQLIGALRVTDKGQFSDFRGQEIKPGVYTLRYGQQPQDGNHIGTSDLADFLLALPAKADPDPQPITNFDTLSQKSAEAGGATHPAIFSLLPAEDKDGKPQLVHNEDRDFWVLSVPASGSEKDKPVKVPLRLVVVGRSEV